MSRKNSLLIVTLLMVAVAIALFVREPQAESTKPSPEITGEFDTEATTAEEKPKSIQDYRKFENVVIPEGVSNKDIDYEGFHVAFNPKKHEPNYAAWILSEDRIDGPYSRKDVSFMPDNAVKGCASLADYRSSGYDRGHMVPAADMKWSKQAMADCHLLTNMCPQDNKLNSGAWATVEKNTRKWVQKHGTLVIVAGPVLTDKLSKKIGKSKIPVPERFFKVIIAPDAYPPLGIGFIMPNGYVEGGAQSTVVSIDQVEAITGFDFFSALPDDIENEVESQNSLRIWNR